MLSIPRVAKSFATLKAYYKGTAPCSTESINMGPPYYSLIPHGYVQCICVVLIKYFIFDNLTCAERNLYECDERNVAMAVFLIFGQDEDECTVLPYIHPVRIREERKGK